MPCAAAAEPTAAPRRRAPRGPLLLGLALALALSAVLPLLATAPAQHWWQTAPYGDRLTVHARVADGEASTGVRTRDGAVEAYDVGSGRARWTYAREGRRALRLLAAPGHTLTLWSDGLVTDTAPGGVRWHRAVPATARWLGTARARGGAGVLRPLDRAARMLAVVTPHRIAAYRTADGDLRWTLPAREGCVFEPARSLRRDGVLLIAQPCRAGAAARTAWTSQMVAVDGLGRITPRRTPLGNELPGARPDRTADRVR
ncbi:hypothetical protein [Streptomyces typhae]|uniref:hypothetical protein n=1 Tax=Streptomyces typhae TaxID=2681492 RepID=UPI0031B5B32F